MPWVIKCYADRHAPRIKWKAANGLVANLNCHDCGGDDDCGNDRWHLKRNFFSKVKDKIQGKGEKKRKLRSVGVLSDQWAPKDWTYLWPLNDCILPHFRMRCERAKTTNTASKRWRLLFLSQALLCLERKDEWPSKSQMASKIKVMHDARKWQS